MSKLFNKLNEKVEVNRIKNTIITETERKEVETKVIFEGLNTERIQNLNIEDSSEK